MAGVDSLGRPLPDRSPRGVLLDQAQHLRESAKAMDRYGVQQREEGEQRIRDAARMVTDAVALEEAAEWLAPPVAAVHLDPVTGAAHFPGLLEVKRLTRPTGRRSDEQPAGVLEYDGVPVSAIVAGEEQFLRVPERLAGNPRVVERIARLAEAFHAAPEERPEDSVVRPEYSEAQVQGARGRRPKHVWSETTCKARHARSVVDVECRSGEAVHCPDCGTSWSTVMSWDRGAPGFPLPVAPVAARNLVMLPYPGAAPDAVALTCEPGDDPGRPIHVFPRWPQDEDRLSQVIDEHVDTCEPCKAAGVSAAGAVRKGF